MNGALARRAGTDTAIEADRPCGGSPTDACRVRPAGRATAGEAVDTALPADSMSDPDQALVLDDRERTLVSLLVAGHTDASAARRLHVSPRTVTNMLRSLMNRLGVNNRFQLGIALGLRSAARAPKPVGLRRSGNPGTDTG